VKTIFETDTLTVEEVKVAIEAAIAANTDFVKTSTGFFMGEKGDGATVEVIQAMLDTAKGRCKIKGSGGIRTQEHFFELIDMGIDRRGVGYKSTPVVLGISKKQEIISICPFFSFQPTPQQLPASRQVRSIEFRVSERVPDRLPL